MHKQPTRRHFRDIKLEVCFKRLKHLTNLTATRQPYRIPVQQMEAANAGSWSVATDDERIEARDDW